MAESQAFVTPGSHPDRSLRRAWTWRVLLEECIRLGLFCCALLSVLTTLLIIATLLFQTIIPLPGRTVFFQEVSVTEFLFGTVWAPDIEDAHGRYHHGVLPLICGTMLVTGISAMIGLPVGLASAVYLSEYAGPRTRNVLKPILEILAGIPTVIYGYVALKILTPFVIQPVAQWFGLEIDSFNALSGGIVVGIMILPMVCSMSEDVLRAVPQSLREAGYAIGGTKYDVSTKVVVPAALSGILASFLLALARGIGETMAVSIAAGNRPILTLNPLNQIQTMTGFIVNVTKGDTVSGSSLERSLYAVALVLFLITLLMNLISQMILHRFREVYQ